MIKKPQNSRKSIPTSGDTKSTASYSNHGGVTGASEIAYGNG